MRLVRNAGRKKMVWLLREGEEEEESCSPIHHLCPGLSLGLAILVKRFVPRGVRLLACGWVRVTHMLEPNRFDGPPAHTSNPLDFPPPIVFPVRNDRKEKEILTNFKAVFHKLYRRGNASVGQLVCRSVVICL